MCVLPLTFLCYLEGQMKKLLEEKTMSKVKVKPYYRTVAGSSLQFGCETWKIKPSHMKGEWLLHVVFNDMYSADMFIKRWINKCGSILLNRDNGKYLVRVPVEK